MQFGGLVSSSNAIEADEIEVRPWLVWRHACQHLATGQRGGYRMSALQACCAIGRLQYLGFNLRTPVFHCSVQVEVDTDIVWTTQLRIQ